MLFKMSDFFIQVHLQNKVRPFVLSLVIFMPLSARGIRVYVVVGLLQIVNFPLADANGILNFSEKDFLHSTDYTNNT